MKKRIILLAILTLIIILEIFTIKNIFNEKEYEDKIYLDTNNKLVTDLYNMANPSKLQLNEVYLNSKLTNNYFLAVALNNYIKNNPNDIEYIKEKEIENNIKYTFGDIDYINEDVIIVNDDYCYNYKYNNELKNYKKENCDFTYDDYEYYKEITSAYKIDNKLFIEEQIIYITYDKKNNLNKISIFTSPDMLNILDYKELESTIDINLKEYINLGSKYQYEFEKLDNNNYLLKGINKI